MRLNSKFSILTIVAGLCLSTSIAQANRCVDAMGAKGAVEAPATAPAAAKKACPGGGCPFHAGGASRSGLSQPVVAPGGKRYVQLISTDLARLQNEFLFDKQPFPQRNMARIEEKEQFAVDSDPEFVSNLTAREKLFGNAQTGKFILQTTNDSGVQEASRELLAILAAELPQHHPETYRREGEEIVNLKTGQRFNVVSSKENPLGIAGRLVTEDLILLKTREDGQHYMVGGFLVTPTLWSLNTWLGQNMTAIHEGVSGDVLKNEKLVNTISGVLTKLESGVVRRNNWHVTEDATLAQPDYRVVRSAGDNTPITLENAGEKIFLRVERQTIRKLPQSGFSLFTVKIYTYRLSDVAKLPEVAKRLAGGLDLYLQGEGVEFTEFHDIVKAYLALPAATAQP